MKRHARPTAVLGAFAVASTGLALGAASLARADTAAQPIPFVEPWTDIARITANDDWSAVPGITGYLGDDPSTTASGTDPQTVLGEAASTTVDVIANQTATTISNGGVAEFHIADPVVALQGSGTADAPNLVVTLDATDRSAVTVGYVVRDLDGSADNAVQPVAVQYRVGTSGPFTNLPAGFVADATSGPGLATLVTPVSVPLPPAVDGQPVVQVRILTTNAPGNDEWVGIDDITVAADEGPGGPAAPVASCPATLTTPAGVATSAPVSATDADSAIASVAITSPPVEGITLVPGAPGSATLDVAASTPAGVHTVVVTFTTDDDPAQVATCEVTVSVLARTLISAVQGAAAASPRLGETVLVEGVVTSPFTTADATSGFFVQEEAADSDGDPATSEGVFVFCATSCPPDVAAGDVVAVVGVVQERFGTTQISAPAPGATTVVGTAEIPAAVVLDVPSGAATEATYEAIEGMRTTFTGTLTLSEHFNLARFGEIELTAGDRPFTFTHVAEPSVEGAAAHAAEIAGRTIVLDDDTDDENDDIVGPQSDEPYPYPTAAWADPAVDGLSVTHRFRTGDTMEGLTGVMQWSFGRWRMRPVPGQAYELTPANEWTAAPDDVGGRLRLASFNVLNYFHTVDTTASENTGPCGPAGNQDCRGADSEAERVLQLTKIVAAIAAMDADVVGLIEIQNDTGQATQDIVDGLNASLGAGTYEAVTTDPGTIGTDAIKVAFIYRPAAVAPVGAAAILTSAVDPDYDDTRNRPALIQTFEERATGERFTAAVTHLKSKGSACGAADPDRRDGQGNCNLTRVAAAQALADHLATDPTASGDPDVVILGDLNAYRNEDPIDVLRAAGYTDLLRSFVGDGAYSYLFDGTVGYLDHALATATLTPQVTGVTPWHANADEPGLFDYNDTIRDVGEADFFERRSAGTSSGAAVPLAAPDARRASDHDPVVVGLQLASLTIDRALIVRPPRGHGTLVVSGTIGTPSSTCPTLSLRVGTAEIPIGPTTPAGGTSCVALTARGVMTFDLATGDFAGVLRLPSSSTPPGDVVTFVLRTEERSYSVEREGRRHGVVWMTR